MQPLIGITCSIHDETPREQLYQYRDYFTAVQKAGGLPVLLPFLTSEAEADAYLDRLDGLLLSGGVDMDPQYFGEQPHPHLGTIQPDRDSTELLLARRALDRNMPILAICRGEQVLAVAAGGTLWQDLPSQVPGAIKHVQNAPWWYPSHSIQVEPDSRLARILGATSVRVNTGHHQAVRTLPPGYRITARAEDGVIEAYEAEQGFVLGIQWHPECISAKSGGFDCLFRALVEAAATFRR